MEGKQKKDAGGLIGGLVRICGSFLNCINLVPPDQAADERKTPGCLLSAVVCGLRVI